MSGVKEEADAEDGELLVNSLTSSDYDKVQKGIAKRRQALMGGDTDSQVGSGIIAGITDSATKRVQD